MSGYTGCGHGCWKRQHWRVTSETWRPWHRRSDHAVQTVGRCSRRQGNKNGAYGSKGTNPCGCNGAMRSAPPVVRGFSPVDEELGLLPHELCPWLYESVVRLGTWMPFEQVAEPLAFFARVTVAADTARRLTEAAGAAQVTLEEAEVARLERELPAPPPGPAVQQVTADGAMVPPVGGVWVEVKTVAVGTVESGGANERGQPVRARDLSDFSRWADAETFTRLALGEPHRRGTATAGTVVAPMDGAEWEQRFLDMHRPDAVRILDFPHALSHVAAAGQATFGQGTARLNAWLDEQAHALKHGSPDQVPGRVACRTRPRSPRPQCCHPSAGCDAGLSGEAAGPTALCALPRLGLSHWQWQCRKRQQAPCRSTAQEERHALGGAEHQPRGIPQVLGLAPRPSSAVHECPLWLPCA